MADSLAEVSPAAGMHHLFRPLSRGDSIQGQVSDTLSKMSRELSGSEERSFDQSTSGLPSCSFQSEERSTHNAEAESAAAQIAEQPGSFDFSNSVSEILVSSRHCSLHFTDAQICDR